MTRKDFLKLMSGSVVMTLLAVTSFASVEPMLVQAATVTDDVNVTLNVTDSIAISSPSDATMSDNITVTNNSAIGSTTWNVKTNALLGYTLSVKSATTTAPAMKQPTDNTQVINDFTAGASTPTTWSVGTNTAEFGFGSYSESGDDGDYGGDTSCGSASVPSASLNYSSLTSSNKQILSRSATTTQAGVNTVVCYAAAQGTNFLITSGTYLATVTATAVTQ